MAKMNKKSMLFSVMAVVLVAFFVSSIPVSQRLLFVSNEQDLVKVNSLNGFVRDLETSYMRGLMRAMTERTINSTIEHLYKKGDLEIDPEDVFSDALLNGKITIDDIDYPVDFALTNELEELKNFIASTAGADFSYQIYGFSLEQYDTWLLVAGLNMSYTLEHDLAKWERDFYIESNVSVLGFEDPLYKRLGLNRTLNNTFDTGVKTDFYSDPTVVWTEDAFKAMYENFLFSPHPDSPSFLDRLAGDFESQSGCCGYESFFNESDVYHLEDFPGVSIKNHVDSLFEDGSHVYIVKDYQFIDPAKTFLINSERLADYNLCDKDLVEPLTNNDRQGWIGECDDTLY